MPELVHISPRADPDTEGGGAKFLKNHQATGLLVLAHTHARTHAHTRTRARTPSLSWALSCESPILHGKVTSVDRDIIGRGQLYIYI